VSDGHENLIPLPERSKEQQRAIRSMGGKASGEARRRKKSMKQKLQAILELPAQGEDYDAAAAMGVDGDIDNEIAMLIGLYLKAKAGDVAAVKEIRSILGKDTASAELALRQKELALKESGKDTSAAVLEKLDEVLGGIKSGF